MHKRAHNFRRPLGTTGLLLIALPPIMLLTGCNAQDAKNLTQDTKTIAQHTGTALNNAQLKTRITSTLAQRKGVDVSGLHVEADASSGVVTLSGHVRNKEEKRRIHETVDGIRGVDKLIDADLHIQPQ